MEVDDIVEFAEDWWKWWIGIQPDGRRLEEVVGPLTSENRVAISDWSCLDKPGQNGFFSVLAALGWWGLALKSNVGLEEWSCAMDDVCWAMEGISGSPRYVQGFSGDLVYSLNVL